MKKSYKLSALSYKLMLSVASSILLILSFPNFNLSLLVWFALVPLFLAVDGQKPLKAFLLAYLTGVLFFFGTIWWLIHVSLPGMICVALYLAVYFGLFGIFTAYSLKLTALRFVLAAPAAWVSLEWLRSTGMFGFGWALLGYSQSPNLPIIQIADITGVYGVSFLIIMINAAVFLLIKNIKEKEAVVVPVLFAIAVVMSCLFYGTFRMNNIFVGERLSVAVVQGNIPQEKKWDYSLRDEILKKHEHLTLEAAKEKPDIIIWPETSVPGFLNIDYDITEKIRALAKAVKRPMLVGAPREDERIRDRFYNSAVLILDDGRIADYYDKLHLVPFGEYIPFKNIFAFVELFAPVPIGDFNAGSDYKVFKFFIERGSKEKDTSWRLVKKVGFSVLICFEDIFPELAREFVRRGASFLVNITNDAWFHKTAAAYQHAQCSVFRAVENRVSVIRAANTGVSCFIDQKGRILRYVAKDGDHLFVEGIAQENITLTRSRTIYNIYCDLFAYICLAGSLSALIFLFKRWTNKPSIC